MRQITAWVDQASPHIVAWVAGGLLLIAVLTGSRTIMTATLAVPFLAVVAIRSPRDPTTLLTVFVIALFLLPSNLVVPGLGAVGRPALLLGLVSLYWVTAAAILPNGGIEAGRQPVRLVLVVWLLSTLASYVAGHLRLLPVIEARAADRGLILALSCVGIAGLVALGTSDPDRLERLLKRVVLAGSVVALLGIAQYVTGADLIDRISLPFLVPNGAGTQIMVRSVRRVSSTASHPIEFGVVLAALLPLALHFTLYREVRQRVGWYVPVLLIGLAIPMAVSRSAIVALTVAILALVPAWSWRRRLNGLVVAVAGSIGMKFAFPGLLGTVRSLFTYIGSDPSTAGRTSDYARSLAYVGESPFFGRGMATFLPDRYYWLDNQFLLTLIDTGVVGLVTLVAMFTVAISCARGARHRSVDPRTRHLAQSVVASLAALFAAFSLYDALSFPMATGLFFLLIGCAGALWRLETRPCSPGPS